MRRLSRAIGGWPVNVRVPLFVAILMVVVSAIVSERVLSRLAETQSRHLAELGGAYLDGLSSSLIPAVLRSDVWETFDTLDRAAGLYRGLALMHTVVTDARGTVIASSEPRGTATGTQLQQGFLDRFSLDGGLRVSDELARGYLRRELVYQDRTIGTVYAVVDISHLIGERREVLTALILTNAVITAILALLGYLVVTRMVRPLRVLSDHLQQGAEGRVQPIEAARLATEGETRRLFRSYNALVEAVNEREALTRRLAEEEKLASLGRLASGMAHEINNPLGGLFNALDTLKHHGEQTGVRRASIELLERGLVGIRDVVQATLLSYRAEGSPRPLRPADLEDIRLLLAPELRRRSLSLTWTAELGGELPLGAAPVRQAVLNLMLNACAASPEGSVVAFAARVQDRRLLVTIDDSGPGMPQEAVDYLTAARSGPTPFRAGPHLGLWLVRQLAESLRASVAVEGSDLGGTRLRLDIPFAAPEALSHVA